MSGVINCKKWDWAKGFCSAHLGQDLPCKLCIEQLEPTLVREDTVFAILETCKHNQAYEQPCTQAETEEALRRWKEFGLTLMGTRGTFITELKSDGKIIGVAISDNKISTEGINEVVDFKPPGPGEFWIHHDPYYGQVNLSKGADGEEILRRITTPEKLAARADESQAELARYGGIQEQMAESFVLREPSDVVPKFNAESSRFYYKDFENLKAVNKGETLQIKMEYNQQGEISKVTERVLSLREQMEERFKLAEAKLAEAGCKNPAALLTEWGCRDSMIEAVVPSEPIRLPIDWMAFKVIRKSMLPEVLDRQIATWGKVFIFEYLKHGGSVLDFSAEVRAELA